MQSIRERWFMLFGLLFLLAAGNVCANRSAPVLEFETFVLLGFGIVGYLYCEKAGWVRQFYVFSRTKAMKPSRQPYFGLDQSSCLFALTSIFCLLYVLLTGSLQSPLLCIIYLPALIAGLRYGTPVALGVSFLFAAAYCVVRLTMGPQDLISNTLLLSFPGAALFGCILHGRMQIGFRTITDKVNELSALMDISQMMETAIDLETSVNLVLLNAQKLISADVYALYLLDKPGRAMHLAASSVQERSISLLQSFPTSEFELRSQTLASDEALVLHRSTFCDAEAFRHWPEQRSGDSLLVSMTGSEGILGFLYVGRQEPIPNIGTEEIQALKRFCTHVSMPLQKARYQESLSLLAFRDEMTDLSNFRYFEQRLAEDLIRAKRYHQELSLLLLDIDYFKNFNDIYGHKAGDLLLRQFGSVLKDCLRESDLPARYGGEEFIVICPEASCNETMKVAERIRSAVENNDFDLGESLLGESIKVHVTVSIGCAAYPVHSSDPGGLVRQADRALYLAKANGRNRVVSCDDVLLTKDAQVSGAAA